MLTTTIQFTNNPPTPPHPEHPGTPVRPPTTTHHQPVARTVLSVNPTACSPLPTPTPTGTHPPGTTPGEHMSTPPHTPTTQQTADTRSHMRLPRKEVIQPHLPVRLPCYDFVPIANPTFDHSPQTVGPWASGVTNFRDVTGGVYKARERIHRSVADLRLLATPPSWGRVADPNPN